MAEQYSFPFGNENIYRVDDFIPSAENNEAYHFIYRWPDWGKQRYASVFLLYGPVGCGKTHLSHIWRSLSEAVFLTTEQLTEPKRNAVIIEDIDQWSYDEEMLLHFLNNAIEDKQYVLLTSAVPPAQLPFTLPDLTSRLRAVPSLAIAPPGSELLRLVLMKQFADRQLRVSNDVINYIITHSERSFTAIAELVSAIDKKAMKDKRNITIPLLKELFDDIMQGTK